MARFDGNRDLLQAENEALQVQLQEAAAHMVEQNRHVVELQAQLDAGNDLQGQLNNALQEINLRDQQIARLRAGNQAAGNQVVNNNDVEAILKSLQSPQILRDFPGFSGDPTKLHSFINSIDKLMPSLQRAQGTPVFDIWMHAIRSKITNEADAALELYGTETNWDDIKNTLITHFGDKRDEVSLTRDLFKLRQGDHGVQDFYLDVTHSISMLINLLHLNEKVSAVITAKKQFYQDLGLKVFLSGLKEPLGPIVRAQAPKTLKEALRLCLEEDNYNYVRNPFHTTPKVSTPVTLPPKPGTMQKNVQLPPKPLNFQRPFAQQRPFQFNPPPKPFQFNPTPRPFQFNQMQRSPQFNSPQRPFQFNQQQRPFQFNPQYPRNPSANNVFNRNFSPPQPKPTPMEVDPSLSKRVNYMNRPNFQVEEYDCCYDDYYYYPDVYYPNYPEHFEYPTESGYNVQFPVDECSAQNQLQMNTPHQSAIQASNDNATHVDDLNFRERAEDGHPT